MSAAYERDRCGCSHQRVPGPPTFTQLTLIGDHNNHLSIFRPVRQVRHRRTPAPNAVRRIANEPNFSTANTSLTSFLRFPPEVRIQIYQQLLIFNDTIQYGICATHLCLVVREYGVKKRPLEYRHRLYPAILECCRAINQEGSEVLYGGNRFCIEPWDRHKLVSKTWALASSAISLIRSVQFSQHGGGELPATLKVTNIFPKLQHFSYELFDGQVDCWQDFLSTVAEQLKQIPKVLLVVHLSWVAAEYLWRQHHRSRRMTGEFSSQTYQRLWIEQIMSQTHQDVQWKFEAETDELDLTYGSIGKLEILLNTQ